MKRPACERSIPRRGTVLIIVVVLLLVTVSIAGAVLQGVLLDVRQHRVDRLALQADRLAEAGLDRAMIQVAADPDYTGETWQAPLPEGETATVMIRLTGSNDQRMIEAVATCSDGGDRSVRSTRRSLR